VGVGGSAGSSSARTTILLPSRLDETKLTRLLPLTPLGMPAASMNLEVADAMLVLAIATASSGQLQCYLSVLVSSFVVVWLRPAKVRK
jgi:hypothetical protein